MDGDHKINFESHANSVRIMKYKKISVRLTMRRGSDGQRPKVRFDEIFFL